MEHELMGKLQAKVVAWRHGNPARALKLIAVAGGRGKTTTILLLGEMLQEAGKSVLVLTNQGCLLNGKSVTSQRYDASASSLQYYLGLGKKNNVEYVIIEITSALIDSHVLPTLPIEMSIVTNDASTMKALLDQPANYLVVPSGFDTTMQTVASHQVINFGMDESADAQLAHVVERRRGTEIGLIIDHQTKLSVATYLIGQANALNVTAAVSAAYVLAADTSTFEEGVARLERVPGNYDYLPTGDALYEVVVDGANTEESLKLVLASAAKLKKRRLMVALDITVPKEFYSQVKEVADRLIVVNESVTLPGVELADSPRAAIDILKRGAKREDLILLLGREFAQVNEDATTKAHTLLEESGE